MMKFKAFAITLAEGERPVPSHIQLMRTGSFSSEQYGKFQITEAILASMLKNFNEKVRGYEDGRLPIDYFHENEKIAAGWINALSLEAAGTELWADVTWTPRGEKHLADRELRYVSAEFHFNYVSNEGGKKFGPTLFGAGLTNRPFIKGMDAVVELAEGDHSMTLEQAMAKIAELEAQLKAQAAELADGKKKLGEYEAASAKAAQEKADADKKAAEAAALAEKKGKFDKMLSEGKVCEAQREPFMSGDMMKFTELQQPVKLGAAGNGGGTGEGGSGKTAQDEIMDLAEKMVAEKKISLSEAVKEVQLSNPALTEKYRKEVAVRG